MAKEKSCKVCTGVALACCLVGCLVCIVIGIVLYLKMSDILTEQINQRVTVQKGHATYEQLKDPSIPIYKAFYFFNFTNAEEFALEKGGIKPEFEEVGPYSYREYRIKTFTDDDDSDIDDMEFEDNEVIGYTQSKTFFFDNDTSQEGAAETDMICTINMPMVAAIYIARDEPFLRLPLSGIIELFGTELYICQEATALAWNYTDDFVQALHQIGQYPSKFVHIQVNDSIEDRNESIIYTGVKDITKIGQFVQWNGLEELTIWLNGTGANDINGTEGLFFRPHLKEGDKLTAFIDDIKRSVNIAYTGTADVLGLKAFSYGIENNTFKSAFTYPENSRWESWCPDGLFYLGPTQAKEIPVYGSKPHFLDGDPRLLDSVVGLEPPNREEHDTVIHVEPDTGANLGFKRQLQINMQVNKTDAGELDQISEVIGINGTDTLYFPVLYINEYATITEDFKNYLEDKGLREIQTFRAAIPAIVGILFAGGAVLLIISVLLLAGFLSLFLKKDNKDEEKHLLTKSYKSEPSR